MSKHHPTLSPSSFPKLDLCACYAPDQESDIARKESGTLRHRRLSQLLGQGEGAAVELPPDEGGAVQWFADYIKATATAGEELDCERTLSLLDEEFNVITFGTPDAVAGPDLFDLKWYWGDYGAQMAAYALMHMERTGRRLVNVHIGYGLPRKISKYTLTLEAAAEIVNRVLARVNDPDKTETPSDACGWCAKRLECPALNNLALTVVAGREDWQLENYHASQIKSPLEMAKAKRISSHLKEWCEAVDYHANKMDREGIAIPGFKRQSKAGDRFFPDLALAHRQLGIPTEKFLKVLSASFGQVVKAYREHFGHSSDETAEKAVVEKCGDNIQRGKPQQFLVKERANKKK